MPKFLVGVNIEEYAIYKVEAKNIDEVKEKLEKQCIENIGEFVKSKYYGEEVNYSDITEIKND